MRLERHDYISRGFLHPPFFYYIEMKVLFLDIVCSISLDFLFLGRREGLMMEIVHDGARVDSFLRGKFLGLVKINKLEQLRKYIFAIEIERIQFEQV